MKKNNGLFYPLTESVLENKDLNAAIKVIKSKNITMGIKTKKMENFFSKKITKLNSLMVNSGSSANLLIFQCLINPMVKKLKTGDEVLVPAICWSTSLWPIIQSGLKVKFIDIDLSTFNIKTEDLKKFITKKTKALMLVHALRNCGNMDEIVKICKEKNIILIEDTCEALGSKYKNKLLGTFGEFSSFSFYFSHHITSGEGGMVCTKNKNFHEIIKSLRSHGWARDLTNQKKIIKNFAKLDKNWIFINSGFNLRPTDINASIGMEQLKRLNKILKVRKYNFNSIREKLLKDKRYEGQFTILSEDKDRDIAWFGIPIILKSNYKKNIMKKLNKLGIITRPIISGNFAKQPSTKLYKIKPHYKLKNADFVDKKSFFLGLHNTKISNKKLNKFCNLFYKSII